MRAVSDYAVTDGELADAFDRLAAVQEHLRLPRAQSAQVAARLRGWPRAVNRGTRPYTMRTLYRLTDDAARRTRRTCGWLGYPRDQAEAAGMLVRAHVLGMPTPDETRTRALSVGGWVAELAVPASEEATECDDTVPSP